MLGDLLGTPDGDTLGLLLGKSDGLVDGSKLGDVDGDRDGKSEGETEGNALGTSVGLLVGRVVSVALSTVRLANTCGSARRNASCSVVAFSVAPKNATAVSAVRKPAIASPAPSGEAASVARSTRVVSTTNDSATGARGDGEAVGLREGAALGASVVVGAAVSTKARTS